MTDKIQKIIQNTIVQNIMIWIVVLLWYVSITISEGNQINIGNILFTLLAFAVPIYTCNLLLIPQLLFKQHYFLFGIGFVLLIVLTGAFYCWVMRMADSVPTAFFSVVIVTGIGMSVFFLKRIIIMQNNRLKDIVLLKEQELQLLKSKINPHFLFNTLNSIYGLSLYNSSQVADVTLILADLMRYILKAGHQSSVSLQEEIDFIEHYFLLEKLRLTEAANLNLEIEVEDDSLQVPPLMFLPLIENAFKHGAGRSIKACFVNIHLCQRGDRISLIVKNSIPTLATDYTRPAGMGVGLENLSKRLNLLFGSTYKLNVYEEDNIYFATLYIRL